MSREKNNETGGGQRYILTRETIGMTVLLLSAVVLVMLLSNDAVFASLGAAVCTFMYGTFGYGCYLVLALLCYLGVYLVWNRKISVPGGWLAPIVLTAVCVFFLFHSVTAYAFEISLDEGYGAFISDCYMSASAGFAGYTFGGVISSLIVYPVAKLITYVGAFVVFAVLSVVFAGLIFFAVRRSSRGSSSSIKIVNGSIRHTYRPGSKFLRGKDEVYSSSDILDAGLQGAFSDGTRFVGADSPLDAEYNPDYGDDFGSGQPFYVDNGQYGRQPYYPDGYAQQNSGPGVSKVYDSSKWQESEISSADAYDPEKFSRDGLGRKLLFGPISDSDSYYKNRLYSDDSYFNSSHESGGYQGSGDARSSRTDMYRGSDDDHLKSLGLFKDEVDASSSSSYFSGDPNSGMSGAPYGESSDFSGYHSIGDISNDDSSSSGYGGSEMGFSESFRHSDESSEYTPQSFIYGDDPVDDIGAPSNGRFVSDGESGMFRDRAGDNVSGFDSGSDGSAFEIEGLNVNSDDESVPGVVDRGRKGIDSTRSFDDSVGVGDGVRPIMPESEGRETRGKGASGSRRRFEDLFEGEDEELSSFDPSVSDVSRGTGLPDDPIDFRDRVESVESVRPGRINPRSLINPSDDDEPDVKEEKKPHVWKRYNAPSIDLLKEYSELGVTDETEIEKNKNAIVEALADYRIESEVVNVIVGCKITRYDVRILNNTQMQNAEKHARDIQLALKKESINVYVNYKISALSVEVPNRKSGTIGLKALLECRQFQKAEHGGLAFGLGKDMEGECICPDITDMPHLLIAGTTGSGKSVCLNSMIISLIYKYSPEELRLILIDPKQVEFVPYSNLPHLMIDEIPSSVDKVIKLLNWTIGEMERRYSLFREMTVKNGKTTRDIKEYNENVEKKQDKLCKIVVIMDEFGDLMMQARKEIETLIIRLVQKSRACGIHLILATQRPSVDCITGLIKSNLPARIGFKVNSFKDSTTIFDRSGAEKLLGSGDMLFRRPDRDELVRIQGCYVSAAEVQAITDYVKENNETYFDESLKEYINTVDTPETGGQRGVEDPDAKFDETYVKVLGFCVSHNTASISMIQRNFPIGYIKACKIVDWMENMNYISPNEGSKSRKVLLSREEFIATYGEEDLNG